MQTADEAELAKLGYRQELRRGLGAFGSFALAFSIISVLTGAVQLYGWGLKHGGPIGVVGGWVLVSLLTLPMALSMAQLASAYPTAGALYHWATILGGRQWGFATAWLNTLGQVAITASIDFGMAQLVCGLTGLGDRQSVVLPVYALILASHAGLNHIGVGVVEVLNRISAWYHLLGVAAVVGVLAAVAPLQPVAFLAKTATVDGSVAMGLALALLQAQWTFTGYDASAHVTEETHDPTRAAPKGIVLSVVVSAVAGLALVVVVTLAIADLPAVMRLADAEVFPAVLKQALGPQLGGALVWMCVGAMWFCGLGSLTSNSRMLYAFARDGGVPKARLVAAVSAKFQTPHIALWICAIAAFVLALWAEAYAAMTALSTIALYASYALPVWLGARAKQRGTWRHFGPFALGRWSAPLNALAVGWTLVVMVLFVLPPNQLAGYTFAGTIGALVVYWFGSQRATFAPPVKGLDA